MIAAGNTPYAWKYSFLLNDEANRGNVTNTRDILGGHGQKTAAPIIYKGAVVTPGDAEATVWRIRKRRKQTPNYKPCPICRASIRAGRWASHIFAAHPAEATAIEGVPWVEKICGICAESYIGDRGFTGTPCCLVCGMTGRRS